MLGSKLQCQKGSNLIPFSYKIVRAGGKDLAVEYVVVNVELVELDGSKVVRVVRPLGLGHHRRCGVLCRRVFGPRDRERHLGGSAHPIQIPNCVPGSSPGIFLSKVDRCVPHPACQLEVYRCAQVRQNCRKGWGSGPCHPEQGISSLRPCTRSAHVVTLADWGCSSCLKQSHSPHQASHAGG